MSNTLENLKNILRDEVKKLKNYPDTGNLIEAFKNDRKKILYFFNRIQKAKRILIIGDFDNDGFTSTAMMKKIATNLIGEREVHTYIPSRYDGYSLDFEITSDLIKQGDYDLIIHLDNGSSYDNVLKIAKRNMGEYYLIIDHHPDDRLKTLPYFVLNPNVKGGISTSTGLIINYLYDILYKAHHKINPIFKEDLGADYFDELRALSALSDMVDLNSQYNRAQIKKGLDKIAISENFLYQKLNKDDLITELNFKIIPLINALGRIASTKDINEFDYETFFFEKEDKKKFYKVYDRLMEFNNFRKEATNHFFSLALKEFEKEKKDGTLKDVFVFYHSNMPIGINGLIAQKIYQTTGVRTIALSPNPINPTLFYGSGRGKDLKKFVEFVKRENKLNFNFGGHNDAFGLTIDTNYVNLDEVTSALKKARFDFPDFKIKILIDEPLNIVQLNLLGEFYKKITNSIPLKENYYLKLKFDTINIKKIYNEAFAKVEIDEYYKNILMSPDIIKNIHKNGVNEITVALPYGESTIFLNVLPQSIIKDKESLKSENRLDDSVKNKKRKIS